MSTLGVRAVKEQTSVGSSLFAQPLMLAAVPMEGDAPETHRLARRSGACRRLSSSRSASPGDSDLALLSDHLSLFRRWYYRPEKQRAGEPFLPNPDGSWPVRRILRGAARQVLGEPEPLPEVQREAAKKATKEAKTRVLHKGRPDVERVVPVVDRKAEGEP